MSGNPPTPTALLRLAGSYRATRRKKEPQPERKKLKPPANASEEVLAEWNRLVAVLEPMRVITVVDELALEQFAEYLVRWKKATAQLEKLGEVIPVRNAQGAVVSFKRSPWVAMQIEYGLMVRRYSCEFGMTPAARSRVETTHEETQDFTFSRSKAVG